MSDVLERLTQQELNVVKLIALGYNNTRISEELFINIKSVENYIYRIISKLKPIPEYYNVRVYIANLVNNPKICYRYMSYAL